MNCNISNKIAVIGGSSKGLGKACALSLAREGVNLVLCSRNIDNLNHTRNEILASYPKVEILCIPADMSKIEDNKLIVQKAIERFGTIDILINNSGGPRAGSFSKLSFADYDEAYNNVLMYSIRMIYNCLPYMQAKKWGRIINIASLSVKEPAPTLLLSNVFRAGLISFSKSVSKELIGEGITINNICPGAFKTERAIQLMKNRSEVEGKSIEEIEIDSIRSFPQHRYQKPEELGDLVCFLASDLASSITGTTIQIDGGISNSLF